MDKTEYSSSIVSSGKHRISHRMPPPEVHVKQEATRGAPSRAVSAAWIYPAALTLLVMAGAALRFAHLTSKPFWFDECFSVELARLGWGSFVRVIWWREANMSLYYLLLRAWLHVAQSEFFIRSLSVVFAVATVPAIYGLARLLFDQRVALFSAALFTFNAYNVRYSQEARSYTLFVFLATLCAGFFVSWSRNPRRRNCMAHAAVSILAVYSHFYALLLVAAQWLTLRLFGPPNPQDPKCADLAASHHRPWKAIAIGVLPLLFFVSKTGAGPMHWIHRPGWRDLLAFARDVSGGSNWLLPSIFAVACVAAAAPCAKQLLKSNAGFATWRIQFLLLWLLFPIIVTVGLSFFRPVFLPRFLIFCQPALIILAAAGIARWRKIWLVAPALGVAMLLALQGIFFVYGHDYDDQRDGSGQAVNFILDNSRPGDAILFHIAEARVPYEFFRSLRAGENTASPKFSRPLGPDILYPHFGSGLDYSDFKAKPIPEILRSEFPGYSRLWVMFMYSQGGGAGRTTALVRRIVAESFPHTACRDFPRVEVCLYTRGQDPETRGQF
jgi:mannosyltransferase